MDGDGLLRGRLVAVEPSAGAGAPLAAVELAAGPLATVRLVVADVPVADLAPGTRLRVGAVVTVEVAGPGVDPGGVAEAGSVETMAARVVEGGPVEAGDPVAVEAVVMALEPVLDLHAFRPEDVADVVTAYLEEARARRLAEVRIVHGRGRGVQRALVRRVLVSAPGVLAFADAPPERGGWGATLVRLRVDGDPGAR